MATKDHPFYAKAFAAFQAGVQAADPYDGVLANLPDFKTPPLVIAVGKAAMRMAAAAMDNLPDYSDVIVVTNPENAEDLIGVTVFAAAHPVPDEVGLAASQYVISAINTAELDRPILCLISGGGSALLPAPVEGVSLTDKAALNSALLASGADIVTMNMIRQQVSRLKGGGLLQVAGTRPVTSLILSDVVGDDLRAIASGPTVEPIGTRAQAVAAMRDLGLWDTLPGSVVEYLKTEKDRGSLPIADNIMVGSNAISQNAMASALPDAVWHQRAVEGDVAEAAAWVATLGAGAHVFGGECTVKLVGNGKGGRNQDMALRVALLAEQQGWVGQWLYLQAGTDGRDGPTDAAGGVVTEQTLGLIGAAGFDPRAMLDNNDAYPALKAADALVMTGGTGTNVADLGILIRS